MKKERRSGFNVLIFANHSMEWSLLNETSIQLSRAELISETSIDGLRL